jgi:hypothetical protein
VAFVFVVGDQQPDFKETPTAIEQMRDTFPRGQFPGAMLLFNSRLAAALTQLLFNVSKGIDQMAHMRRTRKRLGCVGGFGERFRRHPEQVYRWPWIRPKCWAAS